MTTTTEAGMPDEHEMIDLRIELDSISADYADAHCFPAMRYFAKRYFDERRARKPDAEYLAAMVEWGELEESQILSLLSKRTAELISCALHAKALTGHSHLSQPAKLEIPPGYVLLPIEPTDGMLEPVMSDLAPSRTSTLNAAMRLSIGRAYRLMIAAAPPPPSAGGGDE